MQVQKKFNTITYLSDFHVKSTRNALEISDIQIKVQLFWKAAKIWRNLPLVFDITGKSLSEALIFAEYGENMLCTYINRSECQKQFLFTTRSELGIFMY